MKKSLICVALSVLLVSVTFSQKRAQSKPTKANPIVFAVLNDGQTIEPIANIKNGKLVEKGSSDDAENALKDFVKSYYKPKTNYDLIFGGSLAGKVLVVKSNLNSDCAANLANVTTASAKTKLKGLIMGLATNSKGKKPGSGVRRLPTAVERTEIEKLVRSEFGKEKIASKVLNNLKYHNLTAIDSNNDAEVELVGSYWIPTTTTERALLFFIAEKDKSGKYKFGFKEFQTIKQADVMSGEIKDLDNGILHELLLDIFDTDGDGISEIFTIGRAFEGNNFNVYKRDKGEWSKILETYNYHCGY